MARSRQKNELRSGYTTGACAAAAAKAALQLLCTGTVPEQVEIPFPDGSRHKFALCRCRREGDGALATVVKDAGDDPDVTNGAEIGVILHWAAQENEGAVSTGSNGASGTVVFAQGPGVGRVTKPGLALPVGEAAINPVPRQMILAALDEVMPPHMRPILEVQVFVENGNILAEKTLNQRLGIIGGLSILGTTGIVRPISAKAWTDTIEASMDVARATGLHEVVLSTGRTSEAAVQKQLHLPEEALVMMGDYLRYALEAAGRHGFTMIHLAAMWAKLVKAALAIPQTHVRNGALEVRDAVRLLGELGLPALEQKAMQEANTARHLYDQLCQQKRYELIGAVAKKAQAQARHWSGLPVQVYLVTAEEGVVVHVPH
ncbi:MAG: cobalt-precorrin-5B (C(1))-methyltransferase [Desulfobulbaceae bacterium]|nr:cobalt-precorrin-5B (C(1))-methyltransferase [Desulfobulbaceae bacterium]